MTGVAHLGPEKVGDPALIGKKLGLLNGSSWITGWANYFGRLFLPGVQLINAGNDAVQLNFMRDYAAGKPVPPQSNIDCFVRYAIDLVELSQVDAVLITCSTMNRSYPAVQQALDPYHISVLPIDQPMMEDAVNLGGKILVIATHGPTVKNTQALLSETATRLGKTIEYDGLTLEEAWHRLETGDVVGHNQVLKEGIVMKQREQTYTSVVLAQLSMSAFLFSFPDPIEEFGIPVLTSGECGFKRMRKILTQISQ